MGNLCATFKLFGMEHFLYILLAIAISFMCVWFLRKYNHKQKMIDITMVSLMLFFVVLEYVGRIIGLQNFNFWENLPINSFQVFAIISLFVLITDKISWEKFLYLVAMPISAFSIFFIPNVYTTMGTFSLATICFVFANITIIIYSILRMLWSGEDLYTRNVVESLINYVIFVAAGHIINVFFRFTAWGLSADYFGTMAENYNLYIGWISSLISVPFICHLPLFVILVGIECLLKIPFDIFKTNKEQRAQLEELVALGNLKTQQKYRESQRKERSQILIKGESTTNRENGQRISSDGFVNTSKPVDTNNNDE